MIINYQPESCPQCGVNFRGYYDAMKRGFEDTNVVELTKVRSAARYKGIGKALIKGFVFGALFLSLSWKGPETVGFWDHMRLFFSENPYIASFLYALPVFLFVLIELAGKTNSRKEQQMWEQFLQKQEPKRNSLLNP